MRFFCYATSGARPSSAFVLAIHACLGHHATTIYIFVWIWQITLDTLPLHAAITQPDGLLVSARAYQSINSIFLLQQTSTSRAYQPRNQPANRPNWSSWCFLGENRNLLMCQKVMERTHQTKHLGSFLEHCGWEIHEDAFGGTVHIQFMLCYADATFRLWKVSLLCYKWIAEFW